MLFKIKIRYLLCPDRGISEEVLAQYIASTYLPDGGVSYREGKMDPDLTALARIWAKLGPQTYEWLHSLDPDFRQATSALFTTPRFMRLWEGYRPHLQGLIATYGRWKYSQICAAYCAAMSGMAKRLDEEETNNER